MPPKGWKKYPDGFKPVNSTGTPVKEKEKYKLDDLLLPKATIHRLATETLPSGGQMPSEGLLALRRSTAVFISYLSAEANTIAQNAGRKTIQPGDVTKALENLRFGSFVPEVREQLENYERFMSEKRRLKQQDDGPEQQTIETEDQPVVDDDNNEEEIDDTAEADDHIISDDEEKEFGGQLNKKPKLQQDTENDDDDE